jgi:hypothetical protein
MQDAKRAAAPFTAIGVAAARQPRLVRMGDFLFESPLVLWVNSGEQRQVKLDERQGQEMGTIKGVTQKIKENKYECRRS